MSDSVPTVSYEILIAKAIQVTGRITSASEFTLRSLFNSEEWSMLGKGEKLQLGRLFKYEVLNGRVPGIVFAGKPKGGSNMYRKTR